ncbi:MAG TPA: hypothetical protein PLT98_06940 [Thauera aminoaromatica]|nr:hypothetical protein [Thauera aminoaromatica]
MARQPSIISATTGASRAATLDSVRVESFSADDEPDVRAQQLARLQQSVAEATQAARGPYRNGAKVFEGVAVGTGGARVVLEHRLGRTAKWSVIDFTGAAGASLVRSTTSGDRNDENCLTLLSYAAGVATIEVF